MSSQYSEGICQDGAAILRDGQPMTISEILEALREREQEAEPVAWYDPNNPNDIAAICFDAGDARDYELDTGAKLVPLVHANTQPPKAKIPNEHGKNRYGLDMSYFRNLINRELNRPLTDFRPDELARVLARASRTADSAVLQEAEFQPAKAQIPEATVDQHLDNVLKASGSALRHYSMAKSKDDMRAAMRQAMLSAASPKAKIPEWILADDRFPTMEDGDPNGYVWRFHPITGLNYVHFSNVTHRMHLWMPTGLIEPKLPTEGA